MNRIIRTLRGRFATGDARTLDLPPMTAHATTATVTPISARRPDATHGVGPCVGQEMPLQANLPRPAGASIAHNYISARAVILVHLEQAIGADEARRVMLLADMDPSVANPQLLAAAYEAAERVCARAFGPVPA